MDESNKRNLNLVDTALFVLCLDHTSPSTAAEVRRGPDMTIVPDLHKKGVSLLELFFFPKNLLASVSVPVSTPSKRAHGQTSYCQFAHLYSICFPPCIKRTTLYTTSSLFIKVRLVLSNSYCYFFFCGFLFLADFIQVNTTHQIAITPKQSNRP